MLISQSWMRDASCRLTSWHARDAPSAARAPALAPWLVDLSVCSSRLVFVRFDRCVLSVVSRMTHSFNRESIRFRLKRKSTLESYGFR